MTCIVSGLCADARTAVAKGVLREMQKATILTIEEETGKQALPKKGGAFEVKVYTTADPQPLPEPANIVVLAHQLSRPSRVAAAMATYTKRWRHTIPFSQEMKTISDSL